MSDLVRSRRTRRRGTSPPGRCSAIPWHPSVTASALRPDTLPLTRRDEVASDFLHLVRDEITLPRKLADDDKRPRRMAKRVDEVAATEHPGGLTSTTGDDLARQLAALRSQVVAALVTTGPVEAQRAMRAAAHANEPAAVLFQRRAEQQRTR